VRVRLSHASANSFVSADLTVPQDSAYAKSGVESRHQEPSKWIPDEKENG